MHIYGCISPKESLRQALGSGSFYLEGDSRKQGEERGEGETGKAEVAVKARCSEWVPAVGGRLSSHLEARGCGNREVGNIFRDPDG